MTLRIPGHGLPGTLPGSQSGDLFVTIYSIADPRFQRRGADLWRSETLQVEEAVLGAKHFIPTLDGEVEVTIPAGVQPDTVLRLRGKGLPFYQGDGYGNLNLRLQVHIPTTLSDENRRLYEQLREHNKNS
jgi:molecular chaperone DnaJ